jgi:hypothetical protein
VTWRCLWQCTREEEWQAVLPFFRAFPQVSDRRAHQYALMSDDDDDDDDDDDVDVEVDVDVDVDVVVLLQYVSVGQGYVDPWKRRPGDEEVGSRTDARPRSDGCCLVAHNGAEHNLIFGARGN